MVFGGVEDEEKVPFADCQSLACKTADSTPSGSCCICSCIACQGMWQICLGTWGRTAGETKRVCKHWDISMHIGHRAVNIAIDYV